MNYYAFYGIFANAQTRDRVFGPEGSMFAELVAVDGYEANYDFGVARIKRVANSVLALHVCKLTTGAECIADRVEGVTHGLYYRSNAEQVFRDAWPATELPVDPSEITIYMLSVA